MICSSKNLLAQIKILKNFKTKFSLTTNSTTLSTESICKNRNLERNSIQIPIKKEISRINLATIKCRLKAMNLNFAMKMIEKEKGMRMKRKKRKRRRKKRMIINKKMKKIIIKIRVNKKITSKNKKRKVMMIIIIIRKKEKKKMCKKKKIIMIVAMMKKKMKLKRRKRKRRKIMIMKMKT